MKQILRRIRPFARLPRPLRWLARSLVTAVVIVLAATGLVTYQVRASFPQVDGELRAPGLHGGVTVARDQYGIPQIYADDPHDLFLAQGYVHAQDRFWEMDFRRHITAGRLSEMFGAATLAQDKAVRTMGWRRVAEQELPLLDQRTRDYLQDYARGVNDWLDQHPGRAEKSLEYAVLGLTNADYVPEPWTPADSLAWLKAMAWDLRSNLGDELARASAATTMPKSRVDALWPDYPYDKHEPIVTSGAVRNGVFDQAAPVTSAAQPASFAQALSSPSVVRRAHQALDAVPDALGRADSGLGSNSWVVSGKLTTTGKPLLANDPHLGAAMPSVWYQAGLHCRTPGPACPFDVTGFTFSGLPGVVIGHNARIAWGFTNLGPDVTDLFLEKVTGGTYESAGRQKPLVTRTEQIKVAGADPVTLTVNTTDDGPLITDVIAGAGDTLKDSGANAVALRWTALDPGRTADALFALDTAHDWASFRAALRTFQVPGQNLVYADTDGNIGYQATGTVPVRARGDGRWPVPGWTGEYAWTSTIPYDELPSVFNPAEGYIVTANDAVVDPQRYPLLLTEDWSYGYRSQRILDQLREAVGAGKVDADAMARIQGDTHNPVAEALVPALLKAGVTGDATKALDLLRGWDFSQDKDSAAAAYFNAVWRHVLTDTFNDDLPPGARPSGRDRWFDVVTTLLTRPDDPFWDDVTTPVRETRDDILRRAMSEAFAELSGSLGPDPTRWHWGDLHQLTLTNQSLGTSGVGPVEWLLNRGPIPVGGGPDAVDATGWDAQQGYAVTSLPSMRMIVDVGDYDRSRWINLTGASGHAFNDNYWDQARPWSQGATVAMVSSADAVRTATVHTLTLRP